MRTAGIILLLIAFAVAASAEPKKVSLEAQNMPLAKAVQSLSSQSGFQILLDEEVTGSVSAQLTNVSLEQILGIIATANNLKWQKLYASADEDGRIPVSIVKAQVAALAAMKDTSLMVYDPATKKQTIFARVDSSEEEKAVVNPDKLGLKPLYFVSSLEPAAGEEKQESPSGKLKEYQEVQQQRMNMFLGMTPDEQKSAMEQEVLSVMNLPLDVRTQLVTGMVRAGMGMTPQIRNDFVAMMRGMFQGQGAR